MKYMKKIIQISILLLFAGTSFVVEAQSITKAGTNAADFLRIPVGARASAMSAFVATVNDASSMILNPAGLTNIASNQIDIELTDMYLDFIHSYVAVAVPTKKGVAGIHVLALNFGEFEETTGEAQGLTGRTFGAYSVTVGGSYAHQLNPKLSLGGTLKFVYESIQNSSASGLAFDVGTIYRTPFDDILFGVSVTNVGSKMQMTGNDLIIPCDPDESSEGNNITDCYLSTNEYDLPLMLKVGLAWDAFTNENTRVTLTIDGNNPSNNVQSLSIGGELSLMNDLVMIRGGIPYIGQDDRIETFNAGIGFKYQATQDLGLAFNFTYHGYEYLGDVNKLSLQVYF